MLIVKWNVVILSCIHDLSNNNNNIMTDKSMLNINKNKPYKQALR